MKNYLERELDQFKFKTTGGFSDFEKHYNKMIREMKKSLGESFTDD